MTNFDDLNNQIARELSQSNSFKSSESDINTEIAKELLDSERKPSQKKSAGEPPISRFIKEGLISGAINVVDLPQDIISLVGELPLVPKVELPRAAPYIKKGLKHLGVELDTEPKTFQQKAARHGSEFGAGMITSGSLGNLMKLVGMAKQIPGLVNVSKLFGNPSGAKELAKMGALGSGIGTIAAGAEELGATPLGANIGAAVGLPLSMAASRYGAKKVGKGLGTVFSKKYRESAQKGAVNKEVGEYLRSVVGEENIPKVLEKLSETEELIPGYKGTVAEKTGNVGLAQLERAKRGHYAPISEQKALDQASIQEAMEKLAPTEHGLFETKESIGELERGLESKAREAAEEFSHRVTPKEAGEEIRKTVSEKLGKHEAERERVTKPLYEAVEKSKERIAPSKTESLIEKKMEIARKGSKLRNHLEKIKNMLPTNIMYEPTAQEAKEMISSGEYKKFTGKKMTIPEGKHPLPQEVNQTIKEIDNYIGSAKSSGENELARELQEVKNAVLEDLESVPIVKEARAAYHEYSKPISEITEHRTIGKIVKRDKYNKEYTIGEAEIPNTIINKSMGSIKDADDLLSQIGHEKKTVKSVEGYINNEILNDVTDAFGNVDVKRLESWKRKNPGAFKIYPHLDTKLKNLQNAQGLVNHAKVQGMKETDSYFKGAFKAFTGEDLNQYVPKLLQGPHRIEKVREAVKLVKETGSDAAMEGLRRGFVNDINNSIGLSSIGAKGVNNISYDAYRKYLTQNKGALKEVFNRDQMDILDRMEKVLKRRTFAETGGGAIGSPTASNAVILDAASGMTATALKWAVGNIWGGQKILDFLGKLHNKVKIDARNELINRALLEPETAKFLLTPLKEKGLAEKIKEFTTNKSYMLVPILSSKEEENE